MLHIKGDDTKLKYSQFKKMSLRYFVQLYFWIPLPLFLVLLLIIIVLLWHFFSFKHCSQSCSFLKNHSKQDRILTVYIGRKEIDGISLSSQFHKWTKWNNRLVMFWVVWCGGAKKIFQTKLWLSSWWFMIGMFFSALKEYSYFNTIPGRLRKK